MEQELFSQDLLTRLAKTSSESDQKSPYQLSKRITIYIEEKAPSVAPNLAHNGQLASPKLAITPKLEEPASQAEPKKAKMVTQSIGCQTDFVPFFPKELIPFEITPEKWSQLLKMNGFLGEHKKLQKTVVLKNTKKSSSKLLGKRDFKEISLESEEYGLGEQKGFKLCSNRSLISKKLITKKEVGSSHSSDSETTVKKKGKKLILKFKIIGAKRKTRI